MLSYIQVFCKHIVIVKIILNEKSIKGLVLPIIMTSILKDTSPLSLPDTRIFLCKNWFLMKTPS